MAPSGAGRLLVCTPHVHLLADLRQLLEGRGHEVAGPLLGPPEPSSLAGFRLVAIDGSSQSAPALELCRRLRPALEEAFLPILYITDDHNPAARLASFEAG